MGVLWTVERLEKIMAHATLKDLEWARDAWLIQHEHNHPRPPQYRAVLAWFDERIRLAKTLALITPKEAE